MNSVMKVNMDYLFRTMTTKNVVPILVRKTVADQKYLGRWQIGQPYTVVNQKVDYANEDHCGVCANGIQPKEIIQDKDDMDDYIKYMM